MSDATQPTPRSSSPPRSAEAGVRPDSSSGDGSIDGLPEQPIDSITREEEFGEVENRIDGKQKRKRTSPSDQAILEAEYKQNPKPNKPARAEIVKKVSLNEKEVQIWFQNRRQINRRKSRPLLPHELAAFGLGGIAALSSDPASSSSLDSSQSVRDQGHSSQGDAVSSQEEALSSSQLECTGPKKLDVQFGIGQRVETRHVSTEPTLPLPATLKRHSSTGYVTLGRSSFSGPESALKSFTSTPGYLSNRWNSVNSSFSTPECSQGAAYFTPTISQTNQPASCPERLSDSSTSSSIRLSMTLDGSAQLVSTSPSPPRAHAVRPSSSIGSFLPPQKRLRTLQRSQSALPLTSQAGSSIAGVSFMPRLGTGRSRDARTWEFCCDGDSRDELTTHAESESNGSAVAAISLLRSASNSALKSNANKRNTPSGKQNQGTQEKRAKLGRAQSSLARLQHPEKVIERLSDVGKDGLMRSPSGDSDKENWLPGEGAVSNGQPRRRPLPSTKTTKPFSSRTILGDNHNVLTHANDLGGRSGKRKPMDVGSNIFEDQDQENNGDGGEEVQKFMHGEVSPSKKGDLDCIQGLLSLSQGNWR